MAKDLTKAALDNLKPGAARREIPDGHTRGLYFVLQTSGATSWALRYRVARRNRKLTLGPYPGIDLKTARELARKALAKIAAGGDPAAEKRTARAAARAPAEDLIEVVAERFITRHVRANLKAGRSAHEAERLLRQEVVAPWRGRRMGDITRRDVHKLLDAILDRGSPYTANRTLSWLRKLYSWAIVRDVVQTSPCDRVKPPGTEIVRDRVLDDAELRLVWGQAEALGAPFGSVLQLLILTGQRLGEVSGMRWSEVDFAAKLWSMPKERTKNGRAHTVPLSPQAMTVIKATPRIVGDFVFTTAGNVPVAEFSRIKRLLDARLPADMKPWRIHDLRRSTATGLARIGTDIVVVEKVLNHASGAFRGIVGTYQRHGFDDERRVALDRWGRHVEALAAGETEENVVELAARR
jgi:integrase